MAISSFEHNVIIRDKEKIDEIKKALCYETSAFANVKPSKKTLYPQMQKKYGFHQNKYKNSAKSCRVF